MGLDQYAYVRPENENEEPNTEYEWRKHSKLQEYMETLWAERTGKHKHELNCEELVLEKQDILNLEALVEGNDLPKSEGGFFYGHQFQDEASDHYKQYDLDFCAWALRQIENEQTVVYSCWW